MILKIHYPPEANLKDETLAITSDDFNQGNLCFGRKDS